MSDFRLPNPDAPTPDAGPAPEALRQWLELIPPEAQLAALAVVALLVLGCRRVYRLVCGPLRGSYRWGGAGARPADPWDLDRVLFHFSEGSPVTIRDAVQGTACFGAPSSGKTTGSGDTYATSFVGAGMGGLVMVAKPEEVELWQRRMRVHGREQDLVIVEPGGPWRFNPLDYELNRQGPGAGQTHNLVALFEPLSEIAHRGRRAAGGESEQWRRFALQALGNATDALVIPARKISVPLLREMIASAPQALSLLDDPEFQQRSLFMRCRDEGRKMALTGIQRHDFELAVTELGYNWPLLAPETRSSILANVNQILDPLSRGVIRELLSETTITPEACFDGKVIVLALPVNEWSDAGRMVQVVWKYCFQKAVLRRDVTASPRAVFLWEDEASNFCYGFDRNFQEQARGFRCACVKLCQNIDSFYAAFGGGDVAAKAETDSLLACLNTKIFHANTGETNEWAAKLIGQELRYLFNFNSRTPQQSLWPSDADTQPGDVSAGMGQHREFILEPNDFHHLRTGGPKNGFVVDGVVFAAGRHWQSTGAPWMLAEFHQQKG